jgi:hypothetical protein
MRQQVQRACPPAMTPRSAAEHYELQELSAVADRARSSGFCPRTAVNQQVLERVIRGITTFPDSFHLHPKLRGFVEKRAIRHRARDAARLGLRRIAGLRHAGSRRARPCG